MSGDMFTITTLSPVVEALQEAITTTDIVNLFTSGVVVALPLILVWFGARWVKESGYAHLKLGELMQKRCMILYHANEEKPLPVNLVPSFS